MELEELDVSGLLVGRERDGAEGEPDAAFRGHGKGRNLVVDEQQTVAVGDVEVVGHHALAAVLHGLVVEGAKAGTIQFGQHRHLVLGHMAQVEAVAHLTYLVGSMAAEEERIVRHVEEVLAEVVNDVDALVGGLCESLCRLHVRLRTLVVGIGDALHAVLVHKEIVYLCHIILICGTKVIIFLRMMCFLLCYKLLLDKICLNNARSDDFLLPFREKVVSWQTN